MVSPFLCSDDSESRVASRSSSPTTSTSEIPTAPIPPAPSAVVAPSTDIISPVDAPLEIRRQRAILILPGQDIPISRLYRTHPGGPCRALTARKSVRPLPSHHLALRHRYTGIFLVRYGYIRNHKKTVKNRQARTRERKSVQKPEAKP
ncbi:hypothetical protein Tco_0864339 [Tanacetum coccineum]